MASTVPTPVSLSLEEAWQRLEAAVPAVRPPTRQVPVIEAVGLVLAEPVIAQVDSPPADNSAMDGIAVNTADVALNQPLAISQRIPAGQVPQRLQPGTAARLFTGAQLPEGANCVVIQENCDFADERVTVREGLTAGANIRRRASDVAKGDQVVEANRRVRPQEVGLLLSSGVAEVTVFAPLRVGVIATGDELVDIDQTGPDLPPGKIYESNSPMIASRLESANYVATRYRAKDTREETVRVLTQALDENDVVLTIGGVSVGEEDHVQAALKEVGQVDFWRINIKPGKPFLFGEGRGKRRTLGLDEVSGDRGVHETPINKPVMGLPGNPVSSFVTFSLFCAPFLSRLQGASFELPVRLPAIAGFSSSRVSDRVDHLRGCIVSDYPELVVAPVGTQSSSIQGALCAADVLIVIPADTAVAEGQRLRVIPL